MCIFLAEMPAVSTTLKRGKGYHPQRCQMSQGLLFEAAGSVNNLGAPCRLLPLPPFAMLKRLENVHFSGRNASGLYNIERGKGYHPQRCQMSQELLSEAV